MLYRLNFGFRVTCGEDELILVIASPQLRGIGAITRLTEIGPTVEGAPQRIAQACPGLTILHFQVVASRRRFLERISHSHVGTHGSTTGNFRNVGALLIMGHAPNVIMPTATFVFLLCGVQWFMRCGLST